jgi:glutamate--cysteine ligase
VQGNEKPSTALEKRGVAYIELRSLDVNAFDPHGINAEQLHFLEVFMLHSLLQESPPLSKSEIASIDENLLTVAHQGRKPGLMLKRGDEEISFQTWATELCHQMKDVAELLDNANFCESYFSSVKSQIATVMDPELTPSARMLEQMREHKEEFFHHAKRMSTHHYRYYKNRPLSDSKIKFFEDMVTNSFVKQKQIEDGDTDSFDDYLTKYFNED